MQNPHDTNYPLSADDIDDLIEVVSCILRKHYSCLPILILTRGCIGWLEISTQQEMF